MNGFLLCEALDMQIKGWGAKSVFVDMRKVEMELRRYTMEELYQMSEDELKAIYDEASVQIDAILMEEEENEKVREDAKNMLDNLVQRYYK